MARYTVMNMSERDYAFEGGKAIVRPLSYKRNVGGVVPGRTRADWRACVKTSGSEYACRPVSSFRAWWRVIPKEGKWALTIGAVVVALMIASIGTVVGDNGGKDATPPPGTREPPAPPEPSPAARTASTVVGVVCNDSMAKPTVRVRPSKCTILPPQASFSEGVNLAGVKWREWGARSAIGTGFERGFHLPYSNIPASVVAYRIVACANGARIYTRLRATSRYGTSNVRAQGCLRPPGPPPPPPPEEDEAPSETEQVAAQVAEDFDATWRCSGCYSTPQSESVTGFADDLDPWDGSIEVYTDLYPDAEGEQLASQVGAAVLAVAFKLGICKVDVMGSDGRRLVEHESQGRGC